MNHYDSVLDFSRELLKSFSINSYVFHMDSLSQLDLDLGLRRNLFSDYNGEIIYKNFLEKCEENVLYCSEDSFYCRNYIIKLPDTSPQTFFFAGPYTLHNMDHNLFLKIQQDLSLPPTFHQFLKKYYSYVPYFQNDDYLHTIIILLSTVIFGGSDQIKTQNCDFFNDNIKNEYYSITQIEPENQELLEQRYQLENQLMQAVAAGNLDKIQFFITGGFPYKLEKRFSNRLRTDKNQLIILNTLLRKAAETGGVHPIYLDNISTQFASKIEQLCDEDGWRRLYKEMIRKYCLTVKSYSFKGYSPIIQKIMVYINLSLPEDLSLKYLSQHFNISPSYLSALFKKETGSTLTDYVNKKRIEHSIFLLNTTTLRIQAIATACGIDDINYFTRIFKKYMGKTPSEYRTMLSGK